MNIVLAFLLVNSVTGATLNPNRYFPDVSSCDTVKGALNSSLSGAPQWTCKPVRIPASMVGGR